MIVFFAKRLLWIIILYPFAEILACSWLMRVLGQQMLWLWIAMSALLGFILLRLHPIGIGLSLTNILQSKSLSLYQILWPLRYLLAGVLLIIPGPLSDLLALFLLLPFKGSESNASFGKKDQDRQHTMGNETSTIEGEYTEIKPTGIHQKPKE